jgi:hypothetical protein
VLYFADARWWGWHKDDEELKAFRGFKVTIANNGGITGETVQHPDVHVLKNYGGENQVLSTRQDGLATGQNSGYQAINFAYLAGCRRILLLGFDMRASARGKTHWHPDHPAKTPPSCFSGYLQAFRRLSRKKPADLEIINCTPGSALTCFPMVTLESALSDS